MDILRDSLEKKRYIGREVEAKLPEGIKIYSWC